jgi:hypothetical protein
MHGEIVDAIDKTFGTRATALLDENATLANAKAHEQILTWARSKLR